MINLLTLNRPIPKHRLPNAWFDALVVAVILFAGIVWSAVVGKDLNWDQLNYHFYLGYSFFEDRISKDFIPASGQSYLNPLAYVPFYWMVTHEWNSLLIASLLSVTQTLNVIIAYFIVKAVVPTDLRNARLLASTAAVLTFLSPVLLMEIGTTLADASTCSLVIGAVLCGLRSDQPQPWWRDLSMAAGILMGAAAALKLSNLVFGPACLMLIFLIQPTWQRKIRAIFLLGVGFVVGLALFNGYWGWQLWKEFKNPFFPNFGGIFPTDVFPKEGAPLERFLPDSILDVLLLPFRMAQLRAWIYIENVAPDLRFAALALIAVFGGIYVATKKLLNKSRAIPKSSRKFIALSAYFVIAFGLWQWTSGNGRYGLVVSLLCGPMLVLTSYAFLQVRTAGYLLGTVVLLQLIHLHNGDLRWAKGSWTPTWFEISIPQRLRDEPSLYISVGINSNSFIVPFLNSESVFTNPIGQISFDLEGSSGKRLQQLFAKYQGRIRAIASAPSTGSENELLETTTPGIDSIVGRLGFALDRTDCEVITLADGATEMGADLSKKSDRRKRLLTCHLVQRPYAFINERARIVKVAREVAAWCPKLFKPAYPGVEQTEHGWMVNFPSTDSSLVVRDNLLIGMFFRSSATLSFGKLEQWESGARPSCTDFPDRPRNVYNFN